MASLTLYDISIVNGQTIGRSLLDILAKASASPKASSFPNAAIHEDMKPLSFQILIYVNMTQKMVGRLTGTEVSPPSSDESKQWSLEDMQKVVNDTLSLLGKADKEKVNANEGKVFSIGMGKDGNVDMGSTDYVHGWLMPTLYFHLTAAYTILRKEGVDLGKDDYIGAFKKASGVGA